MAIDPVTLTVLANELYQVCDEMDIGLEQAAFCPIVSEARDRASGIYLPDTGEMVSQGATGLPIFVGTMQFCVQNCIEVLPPLKEGDIVITNDPYLTGTHLMDLKVVTPVFIDGRCIAMLADTAHWSDIGGALPGGFNPTATSVIQEGLRIPPMLLYREGVLQEDIQRLLMSNIRVPHERLGDLRAQLAGLEIGKRRLAALADKHGAAQLSEAVRELNDRSEALMRAHIRELPDKRYCFEAFLDDDGISFDALRINLGIEVCGDRMIFDFAGSSEMTAGPFNCGYVSTASAVYLAMKHIFPEVPINGGCFRPFEVRAPEGSFLNGTYPRAVSACSSEVTMRIVDATFGALEEAIPDRVTAACFGSICCFTISGFDPERQREYVMFNFSGGGYGGSTRGDGLTNGCAPISIARTTPLEVLEAQYPVMFESYSVHEGSAGAGRSRGGFGVDMRVRLLRGEATSNVLADRHRFLPFGLSSGKPARGTEVGYTLDGREWLPEHETKATDVRMKPGDVLHVRSAGGGGYGDPLERDPGAVQRDVDAGLITPEEAREDYGWSAPAEPLPAGGSR
ncbi:MAG: hydantoinase B/oxoprolinase family protein [Solirubrobacteraceae bacterium]